MHTHCLRVYVDVAAAPEHFVRAGRAGPTDLERGRGD